jgi:hypothetical protein
LQLDPTDIHGIAN